MRTGNVAKALTLEASLKRKIRRHFASLGFTKASDGTLLLPGSDKDAIRQLHSGQKVDRLELGKEFLARVLPQQIQHFADGCEIDPQKIDLVLVPVQSKTPDADLFRLASLTWSVPVSNGFGRRMRYLVWDQYHGRLAGIMALGDPVFNLSVRDNLIGWNSFGR